MKQKIYLIIVLLFAVCLVSADDQVFENFEGFADSQELVSQTIPYQLYVSASYPTNVTVETSGAYDGLQCLSMTPLITGKSYSPFEFRSDSSVTWDWTAYDKLRFNVKGLAGNGTYDIKVRLYNRWINADYMIAEQIIADITDVTEWTPVEIPLTGLDREDIKSIHITIYKASAANPTIYFDEFELLQSKFVGPVNLHYTGIPTEMQFDFELSDPNFSPVTLEYGVGGLDNSVDVEGTLNDYDFSYVLTGLTPNKIYDYKLSADGYEKTGSFASEQTADNTFVIEDFESFSNSEDLINASTTYSYPAASDSTTTVELVTTNAFDGSQAMMFSTYINKGYFFGGLTFTNTLDLTDYNILRVWYKGDVTNEDGYIPRIRVQGDGVRFVDQPLETFMTDDFWSYADVVIDSNAGWAQIEKIYLSGYKTSTILGTLYIDRIEAIKSTVVNSNIGQYYPGSCDMMDINFSVSDPNLTPIEISYGIGNYDSSISVASPILDPYVNVNFEDLIPGSTYNFRVDSCQPPYEGTFVTEALPVDTYLIQDYEDYADTAELTADTLNYAPSGVIMELDGTTSYEGIYAAKFSSQNSSSYFFAGLKFTDVRKGGIDFTGYDKLRIWFKGDTSNEAGKALAVRILHDDGTRIVDDMDTGVTTDIDVWSHIDIPITTAQDWSDVEYILMRPSKGYSIEGTIYIDRVEAIKETGSEVSGDFNFDFAIDDSDLTELASQWLNSRGYSDYSTMAANWSMDFVQGQISSLYLSPDGSGTGLSYDDPANYLAAGLWDAVNLSLENHPVTVTLQDGQYVGSLLMIGVGNENNTLTIRGESSNGVVFDSAQSTQFEILSCQNMVIKNINFTGDTAGYGLKISSYGADTTNYDSCVPSKNIVVDSCNWYDMPQDLYGSFGVSFGSHDVTLKNSTFYRIGQTAGSHMIYNAYGADYVDTLNCYFEDCSGAYVRYRANSDYAVISDNTFVSTGTYVNADPSNEIFLHIPVINDVDPGDETFGTVYTISGNTMTYDSSLTTNCLAIAFRASGYDPIGYNYLMTAVEGAILEGTDAAAKKTLLLTNCGLDFNQILISGNTSTNEDMFMSYSCEALYGAVGKGWESIADISDILTIAE
ncbi:MAG: hypothetical protein ACIAQZ_04430 [Sedimentisphaeraceae bacterium JB056]